MYFEVRGTGERNPLKLRLPFTEKDLALYPTYFQQRRPLTEEQLTGFLHPKPEMLTLETHYLPFFHGHVSHTMSWDSADKKQKRGREER